MGSQQIENYGQRFSEKANQFRLGPIRDRSCNDICCYIWFIIMLIAFIAIAIYGFIIGRNLPSQVHESGFFVNPNDIDGVDSIFDVFEKFVGQIIGMIAAGIVISIIYMCLAKTCPGCIVYTSMIITALVMVAAIVLGIVYQIWALSIGAGIFLLVFAIIVCCFWSAIRVGIVLLKVAGDFLAQRPSVYLVPIYVLFLGLLFITFWAAALVFIQFNAYQIQQRNIGLPDDQKESTAQHVVFYVIFLIYALFMAEFLYYVEVFLISTACAFWYYSIDEGYFCTGSGWINKKHLGSLTFGAFLVAIISFLKRLVQNQAAEQASEGNCCCAFLLCCLGWCLGNIENLLKVLNQNCIIVMAVTGQSYLDSAKSAIGIIFQNFALFNIIQIFDTVLMIAGVLICAGIPSLGMFFILQFGTTPQPQPYQIAIACLVVFFLTTIFVGFVVTMLGIALNCVFIYYCFDKRFRTFGIHIPNVPPQINDLFDQNREVVRPSAQQLKDTGRY